MHSQLCGLINTLQIDDKTSRGTTTDSHLTILIILLHLLISFWMCSLKFSYINNKSKMFLKRDCFNIKSITGIFFENLSFYVFVNRTLREKWPYSELFWSAFCRIWTECGPEWLQVRSLFTQWKTSLKRVYHWYAKLLLVWKSFSEQTKRWKSSETPEWSNWNLTKPIKAKP